jgi:hypothetical protein
MGGPVTHRPERPTYLHSLEKLVLDGYAVKTKEAPKRFALVTPESDATAK